MQTGDSSVEDLSEIRYRRFYVVLQDMQQDCKIRTKAKGGAEIVGFCTSQKFKEVSRSVVLKKAEYTLKIT